MNEIDQLARMRDNAPRTVSPHAERAFRIALSQEHDRQQARPSVRPRRLALLRAAGGHVAWPARRRLALAGVPALTLAAALVLVSLPPSGGHHPAAAPLTAQLLAARASAAALAGPDISPGQWVYEKLAVTSPRTHRVLTQELWTTADDSLHAGYADGKLYVGNTLPHGGLPAAIGFFTDEPIAYSDLGSLPSRPRALIDVLGKAGARLPGPVRGCTGPVMDCNAFQMITQLFRGYVMPPKVAAELFRAIGEIPGVSVAAGVANGQTGVAFRLRLSTGYLQLILNPVTYKPVGGPWYGSILQQEPVSGPGTRP